MAGEKTTPITKIITKITRPAPSGALPRKRLFHLLDQGRTKPVIWITAPAGSGKTVLLASYLEANKLSSLWYQLDAGDGDMASFFYYLGLAAQKAALEVKQPLPLLTPEYCLGLQTFTRRYFEQLCSRLKPPLIMVFDDYQQVPEESVFHHLLGEAVVSIPQGISLVFVSRHAPPPSMARFQAGPGMEILGWDRGPLLHAYGKTRLKFGIDL
jgi:LuxR family maltose regulon positive regulatory protein